jgi:hypothetical protein
MCLCICPLTFRCFVPLCTKQLLGVSWGRTGELLAIVEFVDYCAVEGDEMLRELLELADDV